MAFRDDLEASQARSAALEQRVAELEAENRALRGETPEPGAAAEPLELGRTTTWPAFLLVVVLGAGAGAMAYLGQPPVAAVAGVFAVSLLVMLLIVGQQLYIVPPGGVAVISGRSRPAVGGGTVGYRLARAGRVFLVPIVETIELLDVRPRTVELRVVGVYTRGGGPVDATARAVIEIAGVEPVIDNAVERFLGRSTSEVDRVAKETLEGHLRGVFARLTLEELQEDRVKVAVELIREAEEDVRKLGLEIDRFEVLTVEAVG